MFTCEQAFGKWQFSYWLDGALFASGKACDSVAAAHTSMMEAVADKIVLNDPWKMGKQQ